MPDVFMPRLSDTMEEGSIAQWLVSEGAEVQRGDVLAEIETDKAVMDLEAYEAGVLEKIVVQPGQSVPIGETIAVIGDGSGSAGGSADGGSAGNGSGDSGSGGASASGDANESDSSAGESDESSEDAERGSAGGDDDAASDTGASAASDEPSDDQRRGSGGQAAEPAPATGTSAESAAPADSASGQPPAQGQLKASPVVRSLARTHGLDLTTVTGSGPGGRIIRADVEKLIGPAGAGRPAAGQGASGAPSSGGPGRRAGAQAPSAGAFGAGPEAEDERIPLSQIRKVTATRLSEAALVPAFQLTTVLDATKLTELRREINTSLADSGGKVSVTDLLVKAAAITLRNHPEANAAFDGDAIIRRGHVNVGIAVALDDGLIVPVVKDADRKALSQIGAEAKDLAKRARAGKLSPDEFSGGTFTISNLGMFGIDNFTAVLNPPEAAILAVGSTVDEPVVIDGEVRVRARTRLTLTVDHRVLDGAMGAAFLKDLTDLLAEPMRILV